MFFASTQSCNACVQQIALLARIPVVPRLLRAIDMLMLQPEPVDFIAFVTERGLIIVMYKCHADSLSHQWL